MKTIKTVLIFLWVIVIGCGHQKENNIEPNNDETEKLKVMFQVIMERGGTISLYYTSDGTINFNSNQVITKSVDAKPELQELLFELPDNVKDTQLRVDFMPVENASVHLKKFGITYGENHILAQDSHIFAFFMPDPTTCTVDIDEGEIKSLSNIKPNLSLYPVPKYMAHQISMLTENK